MTHTRGNHEAVGIPFPYMEAMLGSAERLSDPRQLSSYATVQFPVQPIKGAQLAWLNRGWFLEHGVNVLDDQIRRELVRALLGRYAVRSCEVDAEWKFEADLYGGTGGTDHGGSGRCGIFGGFNAKGIGRTPLVSDNVDEAHKTGRLTLAEALREVIISEVCRSELPSGAVPILAVIDIGFNFGGSSPRGEGERYAIVVRPNFIRPAHFERSIFFGDAGTRTSHQYIDALRVAEATQTLAQNSELYPSLRSTFISLSQQLGASSAYRLWQGRFLSSNLSIDGAFVDFGAFRSVPSWRRCVGLAGECFGSEAEQLRLAFASCSYYYARYSQAECLESDFRSFYDGIPALVRTAFLDACLRGLGVPRESFGDQPKLEALLTAYYEQEQRDLDGDGPECRPSCVHQLLCGKECVDYSAREIEIAKGLIAELDHLAMAGLPVSTERSITFFDPRRTLNYATLSQSISEFTQSLTSEEYVEGAVTKFIEEQFRTSIRRWRQIPPEMEVIQYATDITSTCVVGCLEKSGGTTIYLEGPVLDGSIYVLGSFIAEERVNMRVVRKNGRACFCKEIARVQEATSVLAGLGVDAEGLFCSFGGDA